MSEFNDIIRQSYVKLRKKAVATTLWQKKWVVLKRACSKGPRRLETFPDEQAFLVGSTPKIFELSGAIKVVKMPSDTKKYGIEITSRDASILAFICDSEVNTKEWMSALKTEDGLDPITQQNSNIFNVYLLPSSNLSDFGECLLQVTEDQIRLLRFNNLYEEFASWPLTALRRYGRDDSKFTFECGRKCETGEGVFVLNTKSGDNIYKNVHSATQTIATTYHLLQNPHITEKNNRDRVRAPQLSQKSATSPAILVSPLHDTSPIDDGDAIAARAPFPLPRPSVVTQMSTPLRRLPPTPNSVDYQHLAEGESGGLSYTLPGSSRVAAGVGGIQRGSMPQSAHAARLPMPLPTTPHQIDDIYEESCLNPDFRRFLAGRKDAIP